MVNYWNVVDKVILQSDILLEIIDARNIAQTRNPIIEDKVKKSGKTIIYVLNKCDLVRNREKNILNPSVFISCKNYRGMNLLKKRIIIEAKKKGIRKPIVGVLGYPNMGKSSVINALSGTGKARTSSMSGFTKGKQHINARQFYLIDTPGVIPYGENDRVKNAMTGINTKSKDCEKDILLILNEHPGIIEPYFNLPVEEDKEETLERITIHLKCLKKGNLPDTPRAAAMILKWLRDGKIKYNAS